MIPIREQIVQAIMERVSPLTVGPVLRREQYEDEDKFLCVWDQTQETSRDEYGYSVHRMDVTLEYIRSDAEGYCSPAAASTALYAELVQHLFNDPATGNPDPTLAGIADDMAEASMIPFTPDAGLKVIGCSLQIEVTYKTRNGDPFSQ